MPGRGASRSGGGPEFEQIASVLDRHAGDQLAELEQLCRVATFTALIGNADAHGKNLAFLHPPDGRLRLAPLYDTVLFPRLKSEAAMTIGGLTELANVDLAAITREARRWHLDPVQAATAAIETTERLREALNAEVVDPAGRVATLVRERCERFLRSVSGLGE